jgi:hypothetical protein
MNKKSFLMGILVMALVFGMTFVGCDNGSTSGSKTPTPTTPTTPNTDPKTLVITGVTDTKTYKHVLLFESQTSTAPVAAYTATGTGSISFPLSKVTVDNNGYWNWGSERWTGNGSYYVMLVESNNDTVNTNSDTLLVHDKVNFNAASKTIARSDFQPLTP